MSAHKTRSLWCSVTESHVDQLHWASYGRRRGPQAAAERSSIDLDGRQTFRVDLFALTCALAMMRNTASSSRARE